MKQQHRYHRDGRSMFIKLNNLTVTAEVRKGKNIIEKRERTFVTERSAERMYKEACKRLFPAFMHNYLVLNGEELAKNSRG